MYHKTATQPQAYAVIRGSEAYPTIHGTLHLFPAEDGTIVLAEVRGVPEGVIKESGGFLGFHIHEGSSCSGNAEDPFADAGGHYNPGGLPHPQHAGDLPPLLCHHGYAWMEAYTSRFTPEEVIGKTIILHGMPDDFHSQPSGHAGAKIACGQIRAWER